MPFNTGQTFTFGETPSATKWNYLWENDYALQDWSAFTNATFPIALIADGDITAAKLDSNATDHGFLEIGRVTLGSSGSTLSVTGLPTKKFLKVLMTIIPTGGTRGVALQFNGDTGSNYAQRTHYNGTNANSSSSDSAGTGGGLNNHPFYYVADIRNVAAEEKMINYQMVGQNTAGNNSPDAGYGTNKWTNTAAAISRIDCKDVGSGTFDVGSQIVVLSKD